MVRKIEKGTRKKHQKSPITWHRDGTFSFKKGSRPSWTTEAKKIKLHKGQHRRHGLHGDEVITKATQIFINNELKKSGTKKTHKKLYVNLSSRIPRAKKLKEKTLEELINTFRSHAFSKVGNLLPGDGNYNTAIEVVRTQIEKAKDKLHRKFFSKGEMPEEIPLAKYQRHAQSLLKPKVTKSKTKIKAIVNDILLNVAIPSIKQAKSIITVDQAMNAIIDTTKIDIGFGETKFFKRYNKQVLAIDTRLKRGFTAEEGLTQEIFNKLIGYRPRRKSPSKKARKKS